LTGDAGRGCGDASRALLFFKNTKNPMSCTARPAIVRPPSPHTRNNKKNPARREARRFF
jgi:hypothetical protein